MRKSWITIAFPALTVPLLVWALVVELDLLPDLIIGVACMIPIGACLLVAGLYPRAIERFPRLVTTLIYLLCSGTIIWFLHAFGDDLLPAGSTTGGRHSVDATGDYLVAWTGLVLTLFAIVGVWIMIADALGRRRKVRSAKGKLPPGARPTRRRGGKSPDRAPK